MSPHVYIFWALLPLIWLAAYRWGQWPERTVATCYLIAAVATVLFRTAWSGRYHHVEPGVLAIDVLLLCALAYVAATANRWWPIWSTAVQAIGTLAHVGKALNPHFMPVGYAIMVGVSSYPMLMILAIGIARRARERRRLR